MKHLFSNADEGGKPKSHLSNVLEEHPSYFTDRVANRLLGSLDSHLDSHQQSKDSHQQSKDSKQQSKGSNQQSKDSHQQSKDSHQQSEEVEQHLALFHHLDLVSF